MELGWNEVHHCGGHLLGYCASCRQMATIVNQLVELIIGRETEVLRECLPSS